jgi:hypothetical protein
VFIAWYELNAYYNRHVSSVKLKTNSECSAICETLTWNAEFTGVTSRFLVSQSLTFGRLGRSQQSACSNHNVAGRSGKL